MFRFYPAGHKQARVVHLGGTVGQTQQNWPPLHATPQPVQLASSGMVQAPLQQ
jgi:hypothetical protein